MGFFCLKNDTFIFLKDLSTQFLLLLLATELIGERRRLQKPNLCFSFPLQSIRLSNFSRNNLTTLPNAIHLIYKFDDACIVFIQNLIARFTKDFSIACVISL